MNEPIVVNALMAAHLFAGVAVLAVGILQVFIMPRGTVEHKKLGFFWAFMVLFLAAFSLWGLVGDRWLSLATHVFTFATFLLPLVI